MKKVIIFIALAMMGFSSKAEVIASVETSGSWVYFYNPQGRKYKTLSASSVGVVMGFSSTFMVSRSGSWIYLWDADGRKYKTMSQSSVGEVIGVAGDTFTSRSGSWVYTWDKNGKKLNTHSAH